MADFVKRNALILLLAVTVALALFWLADSEKSGSQEGVSNGATGAVVTPIEPVKESVVNTVQDPANTLTNSAATTTVTPSSTTDAAPDNAATSTTSDLPAAAVEVPSASTGQPDDDQNSNTASE
jgi:hypothetical protein